MSDTLPFGRLPYPVASMILQERLAVGWENIRDMRRGRGASEVEIQEAQSYVAHHRHAALAWKSTPSTATCVFRGE